MSKSRDLLSAIRSENISEIEELILAIGADRAFGRYLTEDFSGRTLIHWIQNFPSGRSLWWIIHPELMILALKHSPFITIGYKVKLLSLCNNYLGIDSGESSNTQVDRRNLAKRHFIKEVTDSRVEDLRNAIFDTSTPEDRKLIETAVEMQEKIRYRDTAIGPQSKYIEAAILAIGSISENQYGHPTLPS